jgi:hypothetical protein
MRRAIAPGAETLILDARPSPRKTGQRGWRDGSYEVRAVDSSCDKEKDFFRWSKALD